MAQSIARQMQRLASPAWRWDRACEMVDYDKRAGRRDDDWIRQAKGYRLSQNSNASHQSQGKSTYSDIHWAHRIFSDQFDVNLKHYMDAWTLAGIDAEQTERDLGVPKAVVEAYRRIFFDIDGRSDSMGFLHWAILDPARKAMGDDEDPECYTLKAMAVYGGEKLIRTMMKKGIFEPEEIVYMESMLRTSHIRDAMRIAFGRVINRYTMHIPTQQWLQLRDQAIAMGETATDGEQQHELFVSSLLEMVDFVLAPIDRRSPHGGVEVIDSVVNIPDSLRKRLGTPPMRRGEGDVDNDQQGPDQESS